MDRGGRGMPRLVFSMTSVVASGRGWMGHRTAEGVGEAEGESGGLRDPGLALGIERFLAGVHRGRSVGLPEPRRSSEP